MECIFSSKNICSHESHQTNRMIKGSQHKQQHQHKQSQDQESFSLYSLYLSIKPVLSYDDESRLTSSFSTAIPSAVCLYCQSYLNIYVVMDVKRGRWICPFCQYENPRFYSDSLLHTISDFNQQQMILKHSYRELDSSDVEYIETIPSTYFSHLQGSLLDSSSASNEIIHLFFIPFELLRQSDFIDILLHSLSLLPSTVRVSITLYNRYLHLLRLSDLSVSDVLLVDCIPGYGNYANTLASDISKGSYLLRVLDLLALQSTFIKGLLTIIQTHQRQHQHSNINCHDYTNNDDDRDDGVCSAFSMVNVSKMFRKHNLCKAVHVVSFHTRSFPTGISIKDFGKDSNRHNLKIYYELGQSARLSEISIDIVCIGEHGIHFDKLIALSSGSAGKIIANTPIITDEQFQKNLYNAMSSFQTSENNHNKDDSNSNNNSNNNNNSNGLKSFEYSTEIVFEIRTSPGIASITLQSFLATESIDSSHRHSGMEVKGYIDNIHLKTSLDAAMRSDFDLKDISHLSATLESMNMTVSISKNEENINTHNSNHHHHHHHQQQQLSAFYTINDDNVFQSAAISLPILEKDHAILCKLVPSAHSTTKNQAKNTKDKQNYEDDNNFHYEYIQLIARFVHNGNKMTRVSTHRIERTTNLLSYLEGLNFDLFGVGIASMMIQNYSHGVTRRCDGPYDSSIFEDVHKKKQNNDPMNVMIEYIDRFLDHINKIYDQLKRISRTSTVSIKDKLIQLVRICYHLRYGRLFDGEISHPQESYLLRYYFLNSDVNNRFSFVVPKVQLLVLGLTSPSISHRYQETNAFLTNLQSSMETRIELLSNSLVIMSPETMSLLPKCISIVDCGDFIVIRCGENLGLEDVFIGGVSVEVIMNSLDEMIRYSARNRKPVPTIYCLKRLGSPNDRLILSVLSPSHKNAESIQIISTPELISLDVEERSHLASSYPYTDQPSFYEYLAVHTSNLLLSFGDNNSNSNSDNKSLDSSIEDTNYRKKTHKFTTGMNFMNFMSVNKGTKSTVMHRDRIQLPPSTSSVSEDII